MKKIITSCVTLIMILTLSVGCSKTTSEQPSSPNPLDISDQSTQTGVTGSPALENTPTPTQVSTKVELAARLLSNMSLEEKVGQMFFVRCFSEYAISDIETYHLGGYILFAVDFEEKSSKEIKKTIKSYQKTSKIPLLIGVDEEGGLVNRVSRFTEFRSVPFSSSQDLYKEGGFDLIKSDTTQKAKLLKELGINVNLAPVSDVSTSSDDFIYGRSFGQNATDTAEYVKTVVTEMNNQNIGCTLKHFPGYGNNVDTHTGISLDERSYETFVEQDFLPFQAGISAGAGSVLVSHNIVTCMDADLPASLSPAVHEVLRNELDFNGVIMTDDLYMEAIKQYTTDEEAAVMAIQAGNDLIIATDYDVQIPAVVSAVKNKTISIEQIDESVTRVLLWKLDLGIIK